MIEEEKQDLLAEEESPDLQPGFSYFDRYGEEQNLTGDSLEWVAKKICNTFDKLDEARSDKKDLWRRIERAVKGIVSQLESDRFYALVPYGKQTVQTLLSHFWGRSLQTPKVFFSVDGMDEQAKEMAPLHKEQLNLHFKKDRLRQKMDAGLLLHGIPKGVMVGHVHTCEKRRVLHGERDFITRLQGATPLDGQEGQYIDVEQKLYEGATLKTIDPYDFVFDTENHEDWDACFKAYTSWMVFEDIEADPTYSNYQGLLERIEAKMEQISNDQKDPLTGRRKGRDRKKQKTHEGIDAQGQIEVIEFHGDFRLKDGTYLRNWSIVVAGRDTVIKFEQNPFFINPFVKWCFEETEDGWGISPLAYILGFIDASSILVSTGVEATKLAINPPWLAEESMFKQKKHFLTEGKVIGFKANLALPNQQPVPIQFNYQAPFEYLALFESASESTTGATRQLSGNVTTNDKIQTATEFQGLQVVGNLIIDRVIDLFNDDFKIPVIEKMALLNAMFAPNEMEIPMENEKGIREFKQLPKEAYFGNYEYKIEDSKSEMERKQNLQEKLQLFFQGMQDPRIAARAKVLDLWKELWRDFGYGQPGKFMMDDMEYVDFQAKELMMQSFIQSLYGQAMMRFEQDPMVMMEMLQNGIQGNPGADQAVGGAPLQPSGPQAVPGVLGGVGGIPPVPGGAVPQ